jgi:hypothetical protein
MEKAQRTLFFNKNGVTSFFLVTTLLAGLIALAWGIALHNEAVAIRADGGYYAVGDNLNEYGLPEVIKIPLD